MNELIEKVKNGLKNAVSQILQALSQLKREGDSSRHWEQMELPLGGKRSFPVDAGVYRKTRSSVCSVRI